MLDDKPGRLTVIILTQHEAVKLTVPLYAVPSYTFVRLVFDSVSILLMLARAGFPVIALAFHTLSESATKTCPPLTPVAPEPPVTNPEE